MKKSCKTLIFFLFSFVIFGICHSCSKEESRIVRPHQYPSIEFPEKEYKITSFAECPFTFELPKYAYINPKQAAHENGNPCWYDIQIPSLNGTLHCSYFSIDTSHDFEELVEDAFELVSKHRIKANYRDENYVNCP